jgi:mannose-6-phosphate isomerase-like protein (cupin superfamily)
MNNTYKLITIIIVICIYFFLKKPEVKSIPYHNNIEKLTNENNNYRQVLYTTPNMQLVLMSIRPGEEIGMEVHPNLNQFFRFEKGEGKVIINNKEYPVSDGIAIVIPPNAKHNIINTHPIKSLKLYSIYTPPQHPKNTLQSVKPLNDHH